MKKIIALLLALVFVLSLCSCAKKESAAKEDGAKSASDVKIGVVLVGDENEGYSFAHIDGIRKAAAANGLTEDNLVWFYSIPENSTCYDKCVDCVEQGCKLVITNSYGHQDFCKQAAEEYPEVQFIAMTGDTAMKSGLPNFSNAFNHTYESRYVSGVVAGMKLAELDAAGQIPADGYDADGNIKVGYVGAYPYAEVISGYTAFFLGIKSVVENVVMDVQYTNAWFNIQEEAKAAEALMSRGCVIIGQHADSTGAPQAVQTAKDNGAVVYSVGYNIDMLQAAPTAALTSSTNDWSVFYTYAFAALLKGEKIATDWSEGYETGAVAITALGPEVAPRTAEKVAEVEAAIKDGKLHVFDVNTFTVGGETVTSALTFDSDGDWTNDTNEGIVDGYYHESEYISAPSFDLRIDGITELN